MIIKFWFIPYVAINRTNSTSICKFAKNEYVTIRMLTTKTIIRGVGTDRVLEEPEADHSISIISITVKAKIENHAAVFIISRSISICNLTLVRCRTSMFPICNVIDIFGITAFKISSIIGRRIIYKNVKRCVWRIVRVSYINALIVKDVPIIIRFIFDGFIIHRVSINFE